MFELEPIQYLQSFASGWLTALMLFISAIGSQPCHKLIVATIIFGVNFRKGILLTNVFFCTAMLTDYFKHIFALPRPYQLDSKIQYLSIGEPPVSPFTGLESKGFFAPLNQEVVEFYRSQSNPSYGFPSGHVSSTTSLWGSIGLLIDHRRARISISGLIFLMAVSRMYLGMHFLADVVGGFALGMMMVFLVFAFCIREPQGYFSPGSLSFIRSPGLKKLIFLSYLLVLPILIFALIPAVQADDAGCLLGINGGLVLQLARGLPKDSGGGSKRLARVLLAVLLFVTLRCALKWSVEAAFQAENRWFEFLNGGIASFIFIWGTVAISLKFGWYERADAETGLPT